jgi:hypothetical protein
MIHPGGLLLVHSLLYLTSLHFPFAGELGKKGVNLAKKGVKIEFSITKLGFDKYSCEEQWLFLGLITHNNTCFQRTETTTTTKKR